MLFNAISDHGDAPITNLIWVCCCVETPVLGRDCAVCSAAAVALQTDMGFGGGKIGLKELIDSSGRKASAENALRAGQLD